MNGGFYFEAPAHDADDSISNIARALIVEQLFADALYGAVPYPESPLLAGIFLITSLTRALSKVPTKEELFPVGTYLFSNRQKVLLTIFYSVPSIFFAAVCFLLLTKQAKRVKSLQ